MGKDSRAVQPAEEQAVLRVVIFQVEGESFGLDIFKVAEITRLMEITKVMAMTGIDLLSNTSLLEAARTEFSKCRASGFVDVPLAPRY